MKHFLILPFLLALTTATGSPGIALSWNYAEFDQVKGAMVQALLSMINNLDVPNVTFTGGYMNNNHLFVNQSADDLIFKPIVEENALLFEINNFTIMFRSDKFSYSLLAVPLKGHLDAFLSETKFSVKVAFKKDISKTERLLPIINVTDCQFILTPSKIRFDLGGNLLLEIFDKILPVLQAIFRDTVQKLVRDTVMKSGPESINKFIWSTDGLLTLRELSNTTFTKDDPLGDLTFDYQLDDDIKITPERIEIGINGTMFNKDKGYILPNTLAPEAMPAYDENMKSQVQVFISHYFLNSASRAFFEKNTYAYTILAEEFPPDEETPAPFVTDTLEAVFPFLTSKFGKNVSTDISFIVKKASDIYLWEANKTDVLNQTGKLYTSLEVDAEVTLRLTPKKNYTVGRAEFFGCNFTTFVNQTNMTVLSLWLQTLNCSEMYVNTNYGLGRYRSSPYVINTANWVVVDILNYDYSYEDMTIDMNSFTMGLFNITDPFINYYPDYIGIGMSADFSNSTYLNKTKSLKEGRGKSNVRRAIEDILQQYSEVLKNPIQAIFGKPISTEQWVRPAPNEETVKREMEDVDRQIGLIRMKKEE